MNLFDVLRRVASCLNLNFLCLAKNFLCNIFCQWFYDQRIRLNLSLSPAAEPKLPKACLLMIDTETLVCSIVKCATFASSPTLAHTIQLIQLPAWPFKISARISLGTALCRSINMLFVRFMSY